MTLDVLSTSRYVPPGSYIGQKIRPSLGALIGSPRIPCYVGRGSKFMLSEDDAVRRSYLYDVLVTFDPITYQGPLTYEADPDQTVAQLVTNDGSIIAANDWNYVANVDDDDSWTLVSISPDTYDVNTTYYLSYQSVSRSVKDPIPYSDLRGVLRCATVPTVQFYEESQDYLLDKTLAVIADQAATPIGGDVEYNEYTAAATSTPVTTADPVPPSPAITGTYTGVYNRTYTITCVSNTVDAPGAGDNTYVFTWSAVPAQAGGVSQLPQKPMAWEDAEGDDYQFSFITSTDGTREITVPANAVLALDGGLTVDFSGLSADDLLLLDARLAGDDTYTFDATGIALLELDPRLSVDAPRYTTATTVVQVGTGTGTITPNVTGYLGTWNRRYLVRIDEYTTDPSPAIASIGFSWWCVGEQEGEVISYESGTEAAVAGNVDDDFTMGDLVMGFSLGTQTGAALLYVAEDTYTFDVQTPRIHYNGYDTRVNTIICTAATLGTSATFAWTSDVPEGSYGVAQVVTPITQLNMGNNLLLFGRNITGGITASNRFSATSHTVSDPGDRFQLTATNTGYIDWSLPFAETENFTTTDVGTDISGTITTVAGATYATLQYVPNSSTEVWVVDADGTTVSHSWVTDTQYVYFATAPTGTVTVTYRHRGREPDPGQEYYFTGQYARPASSYNTPLRFLTDEDARTFMAPAGTLNHLATMCDIAFDNGAPAVYVVQVLDTDGDGVYVDADYRTAIAATELNSNITDVIVLDRPTVLGTALINNEQMNNPFQARERMLWHGAAQDTSIGSVNTADTLVYTAKVTMRTAATAAGRDTRVMSACTYCKRTITLPNKEQVQLTLDGSFVAGALAALQASFNTPTETLLKKQIAGFDEIETFNDAENLLLGAANIIYFSDSGSGVYIIEESTTTDGDETSAAAQFQNATRKVRNQLNANVIAAVPPSAQVGVQLVRTALMEVILSMVSGGELAQYQDENGTSRKLDPSTDIIIFRDSTTATLYHFQYAIWLRRPIKRMFGLFSTDSALVQQ